MNHLSYPNNLYPISGDAISQTGSPFVTVVGIQGSSVLNTVLANGDVLMYQYSPSPFVNAWIPTPFGIIKVYVAPSSSPAGVLEIDASLGNSFYINVNQVISSMNIFNGIDGQEITLLWVQDSSGHTIALASNLKGAIAPSTTASSVSCQKFTYSEIQNSSPLIANWYAIAPGVTGM
jgi:hypothetical protein